MVMNYLEESTFTDLLIASLFSCRSTAIRREILWNRIKKRREISKAVFNQSIYRLKKRGFIEGVDECYKLSSKGKIYYSNPYNKIKEKPKKDKKIIFMFDIPEKNKKVRDWIRRQLKFWDFKMIQESVWMGYGPLPEEFKKRLKEFKVEEGIKIFNVQNKDESLSTL
jgi:DNA-binding transcriptional regulator PaaX